MNGRGSAHHAALAGAKDPRAGRGSLSSGRAVRRAGVWLCALRVGVVLVALLMSIGPPRNLRAQAVTHTVDASADWVFVALAAPTVEVDVENPATSAEWDIAFLGTDVMLNGGGIGPAAVTAHCLCRNQAVTADEIQVLTPESELAVFDAIALTDVPSDAGAWGTGVFTESPWYRYNLRGEHFIWPTYDVYLVRRGDAVYKLQLIGYYGPAGEPRQIALRFARL